MKDVEIVVFQDKSWVRFSDYEKLEEELGIECNELLHFYQDKILKLEEKNKQLKAQNEKMRCCVNCKYFVDSDNVCNQGLYLANRDFRECYEWELAE